MMHFKLVSLALHPSCPQVVNKYRLYAMYHSATENENKKFVYFSLVKRDGTFQVVTATIALGMGLDFPTSGMS